jgi:molybdopterin synthase catalytic subunit
MRYFAIVRETVGTSKEQKELAEGTTAGEAIDALIAAHPRLASVRKAAMIMVNQNYVKSDHVLRDGDELVLIPPVSGGSGALFLVTEEKLDPRAVEALVESPGAGAILTFTGVVRNNARGRDVTALDYEAYPPAAEKMLAQIGDEIGERWSVEGIAIHHRYGLLAIGEISVVIAISSAHRDEAYAASKYAIERIKEIVPIWKKEHYRDGEVWIGSEADYQREIGRLPASRERPAD